MRDDNTALRYKKIRGKNRILRNIARWVQQNRHLDLELLQSTQRDYVKFWVKPFSKLTMGGSVYPEPDGVIKEGLLCGLLEIYQAWQVQLETLNQPYYLKIWLFENHLSYSQVVCAIGDCLHFYDNTFKIIDDPNQVELTWLIGDLSDEFNALDWQCGMELRWVESTYLSMFHEQNKPEYQQAKRWFEQVKTNALDVYYPDDADDGEFYYLIEQGRVWIGG